MNYSPFDCRKKLRTEIGKNYPRLAADELKEIIPNKEEMTVHKIETHSGDHVLVYFLQKNPIFYEIFKTIYPTGIVLYIILISSLNSSARECRLGFFCNTIKNTKLKFPY